MARILVVDDDVRMLRVISDWLRSAGHEPCDAKGAAAAFERMRITPAAVVVCEMRQPNVEDGIALVTQLRVRFPTSAIVLTSKDGDVLPTTTLQPGVVAHLLKPFDKQTLLAAVADGVGWHAMMMASRLDT